MKKIKISAISYLNTFPFLYGIYSDINFLNKISISTDYPALCAKKLINNKVDIGLIPIAVLPEIKNHNIISDYCIGASGRVQSVMLFSDVPISDIDSLYLDYQSKTSVGLIKILAKNFWKITPKWISGLNGYEKNICGKNAGLVIGDRALNLLNKYKYVYDLATEWRKMTNLPFVFATWTSNKKIDERFILEFNNKIEFGVNNIEKAISFFDEQTSNINFDVYKYLNENIDYKLNSEKHEAIKLYLDLLKRV